MKNPLERFKTEITPAIIARGERQLNRIKIVIDVLYALMMPRPEIAHYTSFTILNHQTTN